MASIGTATLRRLSDSSLTVKHPDEDVRGRKVLDRVGEEIGTIDELLIDGRESKVRFLRVETGGFLGIGEKALLIPVDAVSKVTADAVHIDKTREHVAGGPVYDPALETDQGYWDGISGYYGYQPYWGVGYMYPMFPWYPTSSQPVVDGRSEADRRRMMSS